MCYDISFKVNIPELADYFPDLRWDDQISMDFGASEHIIAHGFGEHPIIYRNREDGAVHCKLMEWGCIPYYVREENEFKKQRSGMLNARSERILGDTKSYWYKIRQRRCLIPVTGIYEHREVKGFKNKIPYFVQLKDQPTFVIPGLYSVAELADADGVAVNRWTYTLITREANAVMRQIHNSGDNNGRMPLFVPLEMAREWIAADLDTEKYKNILDYEMPGESLKLRTVWSIRTSKQRPDEGSKSESFAWGDLPVDRL